jgi:cytochrome c biogenesis protein
VSGVDGAIVAPRLGLRGWLRWIWRQLTSMRTALLLLMLLAVAAVPGSVLPQRAQSPERVAQYLRENPGTGRWLDRFSLFDVYAAPWFAAIYLLLFISLVGCIIPRIGVHARAVRAAPPRVPRQFERFPVHESLTVDASPDEVIAAAVRALRGSWRALPRFRVRVGEGPGETRTVAAERGYLRETGNLVFHVALVGLLIAVATGQFFSYRGQAIVVEGHGFANAVVDYDTFQPGTAFQPASLVPFSLTLEKFTARFTTSGQPRDFQADVRVREPGRAEAAGTIRVNEPLLVGGAKVYLQGNGYAPDIEVRDAAGKLAFAGPVPFLPQDTVYTSRGVIKVPDVSTGQQLGFVGFLLPTAVVDTSGARSVYPQPLSPLLVLSVFTGDLGLDSGVPQNVYQLDSSRMTRLVGADGKPVTLFIEPGQTVQLPEGRGSLTFTALPRYVALDLRRDPALPWILMFALAALAGVTVSLFTPRRRLWVRVQRVDGRTVVAAAALARGDDLGLGAEVERVLVAIRGTGSAESSADGPTATA